MELYVIINPEFTSSDGGPRVTIRTTPTANDRTPGWRQVPVRLSPKALRALARKLECDAARLEPVRGTARRHRVAARTARTLPAVGIHSAAKDVYADLALDEATPFVMAIDDLLEDYLNTGDRGRGDFSARGRRHSALGKNGGKKEK
jgi:hypothetical protein